MRKNYQRPTRGGFGLVLLFAMFGLLTACMSAEENQAVTRRAEQHVKDCNATAERENPDPRDTEGYHTSMRACLGAEYF